MQSKRVCEDFERKMWLFMDLSLPEDEMLYWENHIRECALCQGRLLETKELLSFYEAAPQEDIEEDTFNVMIDRAVRKNRFRRIISRLPDPLYGFSSDRFMKKFAFGGLTFASVLVILFFMYKPANPPEVKKYSAPKTENSSLISRNIEAENAPSRTAMKSEVTPVKYEWKDRRTASAIRHVGASLSRVRVKKENYATLDEWVLQAMALKRKMEFLRTEMDKSAM